MGTSYVGLGWFIDTNLGAEIYQHSGEIEGYSSFIGFNPDSQVGFARIIFTVMELIFLWKQENL